MDGSVAIVEEETGNISNSTLRPIDIECDTVQNKNNKNITPYGSSQCNRLMK